MEFHGYCVRVDALEGYSNKLRGLALAHPDFVSIIGVKHLGSSKENPHYHLVIRTACLQQAFRVRLRKIFDQGKGNGHMSIKPWDGRQEAISYLFHEDTNAVVVVRHNVTDEAIAAARALNDRVKEEVVKAKEKASWKAEDVVYEQLAKEKQARHPLNPYVVTDRDIGARLILECLRSGRHAPQPWLVRAMATRIQFRLLDGNVLDEEEFAREQARRIFYDD